MSNPSASRRRLGRAAVVLAALATVVGVLIEVPVMLSLVGLANRWTYA